MFREASELGQNHSWPGRSLSERHGGLVPLHLRNRFGNGTIEFSDITPAAASRRKSLVPASCAERVVLTGEHFMP
jgi:hypothetical protein